MRSQGWLGAAGLIATLLLGTACSEPGPAEKAGKAFDDAVEKMKHGDEGTLEKAGRKMAESIEEMQEEWEKSKKSS